jgi:hypothetical protein
VIAVAGDGERGDRAADGEHAGRHRSGNEHAAVDLGTGGRSRRLRGSVAETVAEAGDELAIWAGHRLLAEGVEAPGEV